LLLLLLAADEGSLASNAFHLSFLKARSLLKGLLAMKNIGYGCNKSNLNSGGRSIQQSLDSFERNYAKYHMGDKSTREACARVRARLFRTRSQYSFLEQYTEERDLPLIEVLCGAHEELSPVGGSINNAPTAAHVDNAGFVETWIVGELDIGVLRYVLNKLANRDEDNSHTAIGLRCDVFSNIDFNHGWTQNALQGMKDGLGHASTVEKAPDHDALGGTVALWNLGILVTTDPLAINVMRYFAPCPRSTECGCYHSTFLTTVQEARMFDRSSTLSTAGMLEQVRLGYIVAANAISGRGINWGLRGGAVVTRSGETAYNRRKRLGYG